MLTVLLLCLLSGTLAHADVVTSGTARRLWSLGDIADTGVARLANADQVCWEASPASTDVCMSVDSSEQATLNATVVLSPPDINAGAAVESQALHFQVPQTNHALGEFRLYGYDTLFNGTYDTAYTLGYNSTSGGGRVIATEPQLSWQLETDYNNGSNHSVEYYLQYQPDNTVAAVPTKRVFFMGWRRDSYAETFSPEWRASSLNFRRWDDAAECTASVTPHPCCTGAGVGATCGSIWGAMGPAVLQLNGGVGQSTDTAINLTSQNSKDTWISFTNTANKTLNVGTTNANGPYLTVGGTATSFSFNAAQKVIQQNGIYQVVDTDAGALDPRYSFEDAGTVANTTGNGHTRGSWYSKYTVSGGTSFSTLYGGYFLPTDATTLANTHKGYRCYLGSVTGASTTSQCLDLDAQTGVGGTHTLGVMANGTLTLTAAPFQWNTNPATSGNIRMPNTESACWRNAANSANLCLTTDATNTLDFNGIDVVDVSSTQTLTNKTYVSSAADPADTGVVRLGNAEQICWEQSPADPTDLCLSVNASEAFTFNDLAISTLGANTITGSATTAESLTLIPNSVDATGVCTLSPTIGQCGSVGGYTFVGGAGGVNADLNMVAVNGGSTGQAALRLLQNNTHRVSLHYDNTNTQLNYSGTLTFPKLGGGGTITLPGGTTDTLVGKATTDDLSNKSIVTAGLAFKNATSGTVTLKTVTGALGTVTASLPAQTGTLAMTSDAPTRDPMLLDGALCDGTTDDLAAFQAANTALASTGGTIIVRGNKTCVLSGKTTLNSNVSIRCEAGGTLALSTKTCSGGTYPGASCTASGDCSGGGTCGGTPFAPTAATTYTLFDSLSTSESNGLLDCTINANGVDGYNTCTGGTRANLPCKNTCAAGTQAGKLCTDYTQCNFGGGSCTGGPAAQGTCAAGELCSASSGGTCFKTCTMDTVCSGAGGVCTGIPGYPSGANNTSGTVVVANFRNARKGSVISGNKTYDTRKGGMMAIGPYGYVTNNTLGLTHLTYSSNSYITNPSLAAPPLNASIVSQTDGVISTNDTAFITGNTINNMGSGVGITSLSNANLWVSGNTVTGVGVSGNYGFAGVSGGIGRIANNEFFTLEVGILTVGTDVWITNNTFATNLVSIAGGGAGMHLENNNLLFAGAINMPSGGGYTGVYSNSLIHSTIKNNFCASLFGCGVYSAGQDKRCCVAQGSCTTSPGSKQYATCTVDGDCTGASGGTNICGYTTMAHVDITGNTAYGTLGSSIGFDLSNAGVSVAKTGTNYAASIINVSNNTVQASTTGYKWPDTGTAGKNARRCKGGANLDAACAISSCAADCGAGSSCPGDCVPIFTETIFANNTVNQSTATAVTGWQPEYGLMSQNTWLNAGDLNPMMAFVTNKDAGNTVLYNAVTSDNSTTNGAVTAPASTTRTVLGVWMSESVTATKAAIATWGPTKCSVTAAAVAVGDRLCISATAGLGLTCGANSTGGYAVAMEANGAVAKNINCHINVGLPGGNYITATSVDDLSNKSIVTAGLTFKNATSGTVTINTVTGVLGTVTASLPAKTGTIAVGPLMKSLTWFFPGTPATGQQAPRALVPEGVTGCTITNSRISVGTAAGSGSPAYNIARCTTSAGNCTATSNIYSGAVALTTNQSVAGGAPNTATITAGDAFKVDITNVGVTIADITVTMAYTCDQ